MCQSDHPMLGKPDHYRPQPTPPLEQAKAHPSEQDAMEVHPLPQPQPNENHPMLGQNDGHDNIHQVTLHSLIQLRIKTFRCPAKMMVMKDGNGVVSIISNDVNITGREKKAATSIDR